jgi:hypothetical protein
MGRAWTFLTISLVEGIWALEEHPSKEIVKIATRHTTKSLFFIDDSPLKLKRWIDHMDGDTAYLDYILFLTILLSPRTAMA